METPKRKTKTEIISFIRKWFETHPRSIRNNTSCLNSCLYNGPDNSHCAVAVCLKDPSIIKPEDEGEPASFILVKYGSSILKDEFSLHHHNLGQDDLDFWNEVQDFHDITSHWIKTETGNILTEKGMHYYNYLLIKWKDY
jgi:hypothetical protein